MDSNLTEKVVSVISDRNRIDRWIARAVDGTLYLTTKDYGSKQFGPIPADNGDSSDGELSEWATDLLLQADESLEK